MPDETIEFTGEIQKETEFAILFFDGHNTFWLPKSQIEIRREGATVTIEVPDWIAEQKEMI